MHFSSISLFSGAFGLDLGLEMAGIETRLAIDNDRVCVDTLKLNKRNAIIEDIHDIASSKAQINNLMRKANIRPNDLFLISGGPPCQSFSTAGKRGADSDPRGLLVHDYVEIVNHLQPRFFVMENVRGLASASSTIIVGKRKSQSSLLNLLLENLKKSGYKVVCGLIDSIDYGVPQHRERILIIGSRDNEEIFVPEPSSFRMHQSELLRWRTLEYAIKDLENNPGEFVQFSPERLKILKMIPQGGNWRDLPTHLQQEAMGGAFDAEGGRSAYYRRLHYKMPSPTLTTHPAQRATTLCHPTKDRPLSVLEYRRIQQFPQEWKLAGNVIDMYRQLGNAVPVGVGQAIGEMLISVTNRSSCILSKKKEASLKLFDG